MQPTDQDLINLTTLADYLDTVHPDEFNYDTWGETSSCGTVACALGHAVLGPFKDSGYKLVPLFSTIWGNVLRFQEPGGQPCEPGDVIEALFGEVKQVRDLFYPAYNGPMNDPSWVAERIRTYVRAHQ